MKILGSCFKNSIIMGYNNRGRQGERKYEYDLDNGVKRVIKEAVTMLHINQDWCRNIVKTINIGTVK